MLTCNVFLNIDPGRVSLTETLQNDGSIIGLPTQLI